MNAAVSDREAERNYEASYLAFFGQPAPKVHKQLNGRYRVMFATGSKTYNRAELAAVTGMMSELINVEA